MWALDALAVAMDSSSSASHQYLYLIIMVYLVVSPSTLCSRRSSHLLQSRARPCLPRCSRAPAQLPHGEHLFLQVTLAVVIDALAPDLGAASAIDSRLRRHWDGRRARSSRRRRCIRRAPGCRARPTSRWQRPTSRWMEGVAHLCNGRE